MKKIIPIILLLIIIGCTKQLLIKDYPNKSSSYPMFGRVPQRSFYYPTDLPDSLELKWEESPKGSFANNSVVIEDNYVFVSDLAGNIFCFNADTSKVVGADKGKGEIAIAPLINSGFIYFINTVSGEEYSQLINYDIRKGERKKEIEIPGRVGNEMILFDDSFFFVSDKGIAYMYNFYLQNLWEVDLGKNVYSSPASTKSQVLIATENGEIISLNLKNGKILYCNKLSDRFESAIVINNNFGFIGDYKGKVFAFSIDDGSPIWTKSTDAKIKAPLVHDEKYIYAANLAGSIYCFDVKTGKKIWNYKSDGIFNAPAALFKNVLLQPDLNERLLFINPSNGSLLKTIEYESRVKLNPVYFDNMLYIGIDRGELLAYKCVNAIK